MTFAKVMHFMFLSKYLKVERLIFSSKLTASLQVYPEMTSHYGSKEKEEESRKRATAPAIGPGSICWCWTSGGLSEAPFVFSCRFAGFNAEQAQKSAKIQSWPLQTSDF